MKRQAKNNQLFRIFALLGLVPCSLMSTLSGAEGNKAILKISPKDNQNPTESDRLQKILKKINVGIAEDESRILKNKTILLSLTSAENLSKLIDKTSELFTQIALQNEHEAKSDIRTKIRKSLIPILLSLNPVKKLTRIPILYQYYNFFDLVSSNDEKITVVTDEQVNCLLQLVLGFLPEFLDILNNLLKKIVFEEMIMLSNSQGIEPKKIWTEQELAENEKKLTPEEEAVTNYLRYLVVIEKDIDRSIKILSQTFDEKTIKLFIPKDRCEAPYSTITTEQGVSPVEKLYASIAKRPNIEKALFYQALQKTYEGRIQCLEGMVRQFDAELKWLAKKNVTQKKVDKALETDQQIQETDRQIQQVVGTEQLQQEKDDYQQQINNLQKELDEKTAEVTFLKDDAVRKEKVNSETWKELSKNVSELRKGKIQLEQQLGNVQTELRNASLIYDIQQQQYKTLATQLAKSQEQAQNLETITKQLQEDLNLRDQQNATSSTAKKRFQEQVAKLQKESSGIQQQLQIAEKDKNDLQKEIADLRAQLKRSQQQNIQKANQVQNNEARYKKLLTTVDASNTTLANIQKVLRETIKETVLRTVVSLNQPSIHKLAQQSCRYLEQETIKATADQLQINVTSVNGGNMRELLFEMLFECLQSAFLTLICLDDNKALLLDLIKEAIDNTMNPTQYALDKASWTEQEMIEEIVNDPAISQAIVQEKRRSYQQAESDFKKQLEHLCTQQWYPIFKKNLLNVFELYIDNAESKAAKLQEKSKVHMQMNRKATLYFACAESCKEIYSMVNNVGSQNLVDQAPEGVFEGADDPYQAPEEIIEGAQAERSDTPPQLFDPNTDTATTGVVEHHQNNSRIRQNGSENYQDPGSEPTDNEYE